MAAWLDWAVTLWATLASFAVVCLSLALCIRVEENAALRADAAEIMAHLQSVEFGAAEFSGEPSEELSPGLAPESTDPGEVLPAPRRIRLPWPVSASRRAA